MPSMFESAMGADFERLHPMLQKRFRIGLESGEACIGRGVMHQIRRGPWWTRPFLELGRTRNILIPDTGKQVAFTIENYPYRDPLGRETITFVRTCTAGRRCNRFDATMILVDGRVVDYLGTHQHLAVDLDLSAQDDGSLLITSDAQRFYEGPIAFTFPMLFSGRAYLRERFDEADGHFHVDLEVRNSFFGFLFGYTGTFDCGWIDAADAPDRLKPVRHEART